MENKIKRVFPGSIAEEVKIESGDVLLKINGKYIKDIIDYKFLVTDEFLDLEVLKESGEIWEIEIEKSYDEDLGIEFYEPTIDSARSCRNKCIFCFIDQLPKGMRETLYFKDDDSRLSFLQGNFITLTNMSDDEIDRIIQYKISPINVSVHTTNPELRVKMLNNRFAGNVYERLKRMAHAGIIINCQIVLCPGVNNGEELLKTVEDLYKLYPNVQNVAAVPIGITKYREGLFKLDIYDKETARKEIDMVEKLQRKYFKLSGVPFIRLSDEFYVLADRDVPSAEFYRDFEQLEDGVGVIRLFRDTIQETLKYLKKNIKGSFTIITGESAYDEILYASKKITLTNENIKINVKKIVNNFFGTTITVAGLLTGKDIIEQTMYEKLGEYVVMPDVMLKKGYELGKTKEQILLDDYTVHDLEKCLNRNILICDYTGKDLIKIINEYSKEE